MKLLKGYKHGKGVGYSVKGTAGGLDSTLHSVVSKTVKGKTGKASPESIIKNIK